MSIEQFIRDLDHEQLYFEFQPIVDLKTLKIYGYEALLRNTGKYNPEVFINCAQSMGRWQAIQLVLFHTILNTWCNLDSDGYIFINLDIENISEYRMYSKILESYKGILDTSKIVIEITERSSILLATDCTVPELTRKAGVRLALDDYTSEKSGCQSLMNWDFDIIKIDGKLISGIDASRKQQVIFDDIAQLARRLNALTVAEFIETVPQFEYANSLGINLGQGWLFGKPKPTLEFDIDALIKRIQESDEMNFELDNAS